MQVNSGQSHTRTKVKTTRVKTLQKIMADEKNKADWLIHNKRWQKDHQATRTAGQTYM